MKKILTIFIVTFLLALTSACEIKTISLDTSESVQNNTEETVIIGEKKEQVIKEAPKVEKEEIVATELEEEPSKYAYKVTITINPEITLYSDGRENIIGWIYENEDATKAYSDIDFPNMDVAEAVTAVTKAAVDSGYLKKNGKVNISVVSDTEIEMAEDILQSFEDAAKEAIQQEEIKGDVILTSETR